MGREVRRVIPKWDHPTDENRGGFRPLYDNGINQAWLEWLCAWNRWKEGGDDSQKKHGYTRSYSDFVGYYGTSPDPDTHRPDWEDKDRTWLQVYETVSEGTPVSPPFPTKEELARWLTDFPRGDGKYRGIYVSPDQDRHLSYNEWLKWIEIGWAPSMMIIPGKGVRIGAEAMIDTEEAD